MKYAAFGLLLAGCSAAQVQPGPAPAPVGFEPRAVFHASGAGDFQTFIGAVPFSAFVKWSGTGTIEARMTPTGVTVFMDGDGSWTVTPQPGLESDAEHAVQTGALIIRRNGQNVGLSRALPVVPAPKPAPIASLPEGEIDLGGAVCHDSACSVK